MHYYSSSNASSVYSQDGVLYPLPYDADLKKPLVGIPSGLGRKESSGSARSKTPSNFSQASTLAPTIVYTEDFIKTLGYRPFEYWTGPPPVAVGGLPVPPPPPPKAALRRASRVLLLRQSLRLPQQAQARLRDSMMNMLSGENNKPKQRRSPVPPAPPSPRVKDRYKHRYKLPRKGNEWPGWEPDASALRYFEKQQQQRQGEKKGGAFITSTNEKRTTTLLAAIPETEPSSRTTNEKKTNWRSSKKQQQRPLPDFWPGSSSSSSSYWALQQTRNKLDFLLHGDRNRTISDSGSSIRLGEHNDEQRLLDPRTWTRRGWGVFALLAMLLLGVALLLASTVAAEAAARVTMVAGPTGTTTVNDSSSGKMTQQQQLEQQQQEQEQNLMVAGPDDDDDDDGGTVVHGGSLFRFRAIQRTYHGLITP